MGIFDRIADQLGELIAPDDVRAHVELGGALLEQGDLDGAVRELSRALAVRPDHARAAFLLGVALARRGEHEAAERAFAQALSSRPEFPEALAALGEERRRRGRLDDAEEPLRRALELGPSDAALRGQAYRGLGAIHLAHGRGDKAVRELRKAAAALPDDAETQSLLGRALLARGDADAARLALERAAAGEADAETLAALGEAYRALDRADEARGAYERSVAKDARSIGAWLGLSALAAEAGDLDGAWRAAGRALEARDGKDARALVAAARVRSRAVLAGAGELADPVAACAAWDEALARAAGAERSAVLDEAIAFALRVAGDATGFDSVPSSSAARWAAERLASAGVDPWAAPTGEAIPLAIAHAIAALALGPLDGGWLDRAESLSSAASVTGDALEPLLVLGRARLLRGDRAGARGALRRAAELSPPGDGRARALLGRLYREGQPRLADDLDVVLRAAHERLRETPELSDLAPEAARLVETLDRPMLLTVMGEFNAGKSTFVNALVGEEVAPMGITPTTATINVLKYGAERGGRVVYRDGRLRHVPWAEVGALLRGLDEDEARAIDYVEVLYPLPALERVNVVDTPGLNSIRPEHEATARGFLGRADAVIWLFSCRQPGTASEREALERVRDERKKVLGVVNMIDRVAGAEELEAVLAHLRAGFGELVEELVPFSAREALLGRGDAERLARSNRAQLERTLQERFFDRSRAIKRAAAARRLSAILDGARARGEARIASGPAARLGSLDGARAEAARARRRFDERFLVEERLALLADLESVTAAAAREVLDFVRPRRWVFGSNEAAPADRDFLVGLVEQELGALVAGSRGRLADEAVRALGPLRAVDPAEAARRLDEELRLLDEQVYGRYRAFARGFLRGGRVDDFFARVLPKLELGEHAVERALGRELPGLDELEAELVAPLRRWSRRLFDALDAQLARLVERESLARFELEERVLAPLEALAASLARAVAGEPAVAEEPARG